MFAARLRFSLLAIHVSLASGLVAAPASANPQLTITQGKSCGAPPAVGAAWFYLGDPDEQRAGKTAAAAARRVYQALNVAFDGILTRDPSCLRVEVLDHAALRARSRDLDKRHGIADNVVGFHQPKLGADQTVYVLPRAGQGVDVVMLHEVLHALSHRFSIEISRRRLTVLNEGATEYLTRELAAVSLGIPKRAFGTGYGPYLRFYSVLIDALGKDGLALLGQAYFIDGYDYFEREVDQRLGISLREAGRALAAGDLSLALARIGSPR